MSSAKHLHWRNSTKIFDSEKKISAADLQDLKDSLRLSPSSYGLQPWHFLVISDPELRTELKPHSWDQAQITDCSHLFVLCAFTEMKTEYIEQYVEHIAKTREQDVVELAAYKDIMVSKVIEEKSDEERQTWMEKQVYIALGFLMSTCMKKQIDCCPMEGFERDKYNDILNLTEDGLTAVVACATGYRSAEDSYSKATKVRWDESGVMEDR